MCSEGLEVGDRDICPPDDALELGCEVFRWPVRLGRLGGGTVLWETLWKVYRRGRRNFLGRCRSG